MAAPIKAFLDELAALRASLVREIEAHQLGLDPAPAAVAARRRRVLVDRDFWFFATTYFPHHVRGEPSAFQAHFARRFPALLAQPGGAIEWWIAPRGECKTSLCTKIGPCWIAVQGLLEREGVRAELGLGDTRPPYNDYVILLGAETSMPTKLLEVVRTELTHNAALAMDFPDACGRGQVWKVGEIVTRTGVKIEPFGAEQAIRGTFHGASRPKVLLPDDLITDKEAKSPTERENRWNWLERAVSYLGPPDGSVKLAGVGTVLSHDDPISRAKRTVGHVVHHFKAIEQLPDRMDLWERCEELMRNADREAERKQSASGAPVSGEDLPSAKFYRRQQRVMERGAVTSWPAVRNLYWLMRQRAKNPRAFATEMQGEPRAEGDQVFHRVQFWVRRGPLWVYYGACDPSMGKGESSDPSAVLIGAWDTDRQRLHVVHAGIKRRIPTRLLADLISAQREFGCVVMGFENNSAFEYMRQQFIRTALEQGVMLPLVGITATVDPQVRIDSLEAPVCDIEPRILFSADQTQLLAELDTWPEPQPHHHYDGLTALHILWMVASTRAGGVPRVASAGRRAATTFAGY